MTQHVTTHQDDDADVIVVGAGPSGSTAAYYLSQAGLNVLLIEKSRFPRDKVCGDGLTPRAVKSLVAMGVDVLHDAGTARPLPSWAALMAGLGARLAEIDPAERRVIAGVTLPSRGYAAALAEGDLSERARRKNSVRCSRRTDRCMPRLCTFGDNAVPLHEHPGSLLHGLLGRHRRPTRSCPDGF